MPGADGSPVNDDGIEFWGQSFVAAPDGADRDAGQRSTRKRSWSSPCDLGAGGVQPHALAVPARSAHRCVRRSDPAVRRSAREAGTDAVTPSRRPRGRSRASSRARPPSTVTPSRPSGAGTPAPGSAGRGRKASRFPVSITARSRTSTGVVTAIAAWRAGARQRAQRELRTDRARAPRSGRRAAPARLGFTTSRPTSAGPAITARPSSCASAAAAPRRRSSTGASTPGAASTRRGTTTTPCRRASPTRSGCRCFEPRIVMEGGAIDVNGAGTVLTTTVVPAQQEPQPGLSQAADRALPEGLLRPAPRRAGSARASTATTPTATSTTSPASSASVSIVTAVEDDPADANYRVLRANRRAPRARSRSRTAGPFEIARAADARARWCTKGSGCRPPT